MSLSIITSLLLLLIAGGANAATFTIRNNCPYTVWPGALPGGGTRLDSGQTWTINVAAGTAGARIWGRTGCSFDGAGRGTCQTGDCNGVIGCQVSGQTPATLAEYTLNGGFNLDYFDISLVDGFNLPMEFSPINSGGCTTTAIRCTADINGQCPAQLRVPGGCRNAAGFASFFKQRCPNAYSFPGDDQSSTFTCPGGANYRVVFCP